MCKKPVWRCACFKRPARGQQEASKRPARGQRSQQETKKSSKRQIGQLSPEHAGCSTPTPSVVPKDKEFLGVASCWLLLASDGLLLFEGPGSGLHPRCSKSALKCDLASCRSAAHSSVAAFLQPWTPSNERCDACCALSFRLAPLPSEGCEECYRRERVECKTSGVKAQAVFEKFFLLLLFCVALKCRSAQP